MNIRSREHKAQNIRPALMWKRYSDICFPFVLFSNFYFQHFFGPLILVIGYPFQLYFQHFLLFSWPESNKKFYFGVCWHLTRSFFGDVYRKGKLKQNFPLKTITRKSITKFMSLKCFVITWRARWKTSCMVKAFLSFYFLGGLDSEWVVRRS